MDLRGSVISIAAAIIVLSAGAESREIRQKELIPGGPSAKKDHITEELIEMGFVHLPAAVDTYDVVRYGFDFGDWQGWTRHDNTAQPDTFFHVDDFSGLGGGTFGRLVPIEGTKSAWCGARPSDDLYMCSWQSAPGYGRGWDQSLQTDAFDFTGILTISYRGVFDSEPEFDITALERSTAGTDEWTEITRYHGVIDTFATHTIYSGLARTKLRFHFTSDGGWDDQSGLYDSDGACIIDNITICDDNGLIDFEDFESAEAGSRRAGIWHAAVPEPFGMYSGLMPGLIDHDPCAKNGGYQVAFFEGSAVPDPEYPGQFKTPFCRGTGTSDYSCQSEMVISPMIDLRRYSTGNDHIQDAEIPAGVLDDMGGLVLDYTVYMNLPLSNLVFYTWWVRDIRNGCAGDWHDRHFALYGDEERYVREREDIGDLVTADTIQVIFGIFDYCSAWFDTYGDCADHSSGPYFDNIGIQRYDRSGPQWSYRDIDLFQDNFPCEEFQIESFVRADMANDIRPAGDPVIDPGDSIVIRCTSPHGGGIAEDAGGPRVYMHVKCTYYGPDGLKEPQLFGPALEGTYGSYAGDDGLWTVIQGDTASWGPGYLSPDYYMFDLNDSLFTRGYIIEYYFEAFDNEGASAILPEDARIEPQRLYWTTNCFEFACLPTLQNGTLYIDDYDGIGIMEGIAQVYVYHDLQYIRCGDYDPFSIDRYDVKGPQSCASNGPASRAKIFQWDFAYENIVWDSGDLNSCTISDGADHGDKSNDAQLLIDWLDLSTHKTGLLVMGDNIASDLGDSPTPQALALTATYCGVSLASSSYFELTGGIYGGGTASPFVTGLGILEGIDFYYFGGCPGIKDFDVLEKIGTGAYALQFPSHGGSDSYIGISNAQMNSNGYPMRTVWSGSSMMNMRTGDMGPLARREFLERIWAFFENDVCCDILLDDDIPAVNRLSANYPNPFNPSTTVSFDLAGRGKVSITIYDVCGRVVRRLLDEEREAGSYREPWNGMSDSGSKVASGVYFCRMKTPGFEQSRKMVLLR